MPKWLENAVFYEIYPQSFYDANGDGIGDFEGIIQKLDYIKDLGCNALWINPCFDSPFKDAGYDVRDYKKTAPRYGTNRDLKRLFAAAHKRGIRVLLDLVAGHTSEEHSWFTESAKAKPNKYWNRYIWTDNWHKKAEGLGYVAGEAERAATYIINFFKCQPALNYGWLKPDEKWQLPMDHPDCIATRESMKDVMHFWLDSGCDGFRVDMAASLVKGDDSENTGSAMIWHNIRAMLDAEYPEAAIIAEWSYPKQAITAGFHLDFFLDFDANSGGCKSLFRDYEFTLDNTITGENKSFFKKGAKHNVRKFLDEYLHHYEAVKDSGYISLVTGNHDMVRLGSGLESRELALAYGFIFTMPGVPFLYYGDEIGMRYLKLPTKEGGYFRTGSRTPMQWKPGKNLGFSKAAASKLYLPVDAAADAPTVEAQEKEASSLFNTVKALLHLRGAEPDLQSGANLEILHGKKGSSALIYRRGAFVMALNPGAQKEKIAGLPLTETGSQVYAIGNSGKGCSLENGTCILEGQSFVIWRV